MTSRTFLALFATLALIAGCGEEEGGGDGGGGGDDTRAALAAAAEKAEDVKSFSQEFTMESDIGGEEISFEGTGTSTADNQQGTMEGRMSVAGQEIAFEGITDGEFMYLKGDGFGAPAGKWIKTPDPPTSTMSPAEFVGFLKDSDGVEEVGKETIRGEETTHYRGPLNLEELASESGSDIIERLKSTPEAEKASIIVDIWVRPDALPARLALDVSMAGTEGSLTMTSDVTEYDVPVDAEPPPASDVVAAGGG